MSGQFLRAAFELLHTGGRPLTAQEITKLAIVKGMLRSGGKTPANTMRARLSDDIRNKGTSSYFQRTGPNRFGLREWTMTEYHARPFQRELPDETTVCLRASECDVLGAGGVGLTRQSSALLEYLKSLSNLHFLERRLVESTVEFRQLISYVWLETADGLILSYTRGKYSSAHKTLLLGRRSVGFGGHVLQEDAEGLFGSMDAGIEQAALREIGEELDGVLPSSLTIEGLVWDDSSSEGQKHIGVVVRGTLPQSKELAIHRSGELAISGLRLMSKSDLWREFHALEFWSQLLLKTFAPLDRPKNISSVAPSRRPKDIRHIVLVGEIANGKSWLAGAMKAKLGYSVVSASAVLRELLGVGSMLEQDRLDFQSQALRFIESAQGPERLAKGIAKRAELDDKPVVVDGLRQLSTLAALRRHLPNLTVIYIDCPRDLAYRNYSTRRQDANPRHFSAVREHSVESELPLFRYQCDVLLNNADTPAKTLRLFTQWLKGDGD